MTQIVNSCIQKLIVVLYFIVEKEWERAPWQNVRGRSSGTGSAVTGAGSHAGSEEEEDGDDVFGLAAVSVISFNSVIMYCIHACNSTSRPIKVLDIINITISYTIYML